MNRRAERSAVRAARAQRATRDARGEVGVARAIDDAIASDASTVTAGAGTRLPNLNPKPAPAAVKTLVRSHVNDPRPVRPLDAHELALCYFQPLLC